MLGAVKQASSGEFIATANAEASSAAAAAEGHDPATNTSSEAISRATTRPERTSTSDAGMHSAVSAEKVSAAASSKAVEALKDVQTAKSPSKAQASPAAMIKAVTTLQSGDTAATPTAKALLQRQNSRVQSQQRIGTLLQLTEINGTSAGSVRNWPPRENDVAGFEAAPTSRGTAAVPNTAAVCPRIHSNCSVPSTSTDAAVGHHNVCAAAADACERGTGPAGVSAGDVVKDAAAVTAYSEPTKAPTAVAIFARSATTITTATSATAAANVVAACVEVLTSTDAVSADEEPTAAKNNAFAASAVERCIPVAAQPTVAAPPARVGAGSLAASGPVSTNIMRADRGTSPVNSYPPCRKTRGVSPIIFSASLLDSSNNGSNAVRDLQVISPGGATAAAQISPASSLSCISSTDIRDTETVYAGKAGSGVVKKHMATQSATAQQLESLRQSARLSQLQTRLQLRGRRLKRVHQQLGARLKKRYQCSEREEQSQLNWTQQQEARSIAAMLQKRLRMLQRQSTASTEGQTEQQLLSCAAELLQRTDDLLWMKGQRSSSLSSNCPSHLSGEAPTNVNDCKQKNALLMTPLHRRQEPLEQQREQRQRQQGRDPQQEAVQANQKVEEAEGQRRLASPQKPSRTQNKHRGSLYMTSVSAAVQTHSASACRASTRESLKSNPSLASYGDTGVVTAESHGSDSPPCGTANCAAHAHVASAQATSAAGRLSAAVSSTSVCDSASALHCDTHLTERGGSPTSSEFLSAPRTPRSSRVNSRSRRDFNTNSRHTSSLDTAGSGTIGRGRLHRRKGTACCSKQGGSRKQLSPTINNSGSAHRNEEREGSDGVPSSKSRCNEGRGFVESECQHIAPAGDGLSGRVRSITSDRRRCSTGQSSSASTITILRSRHAVTPLRLPSIPALLLDGLESKRNFSDSGNIRRDNGRSSSRGSTHCEGSRKRNTRDENLSPWVRESSTGSRVLHGTDSMRRNRGYSSSRGEETTEVSRVPSVSSSSCSRRHNGGSKHHNVGNSSRKSRKVLSRRRQNAEGSCSRAKSRSLCRRMRRSSSMHTEGTSTSYSRSISRLVSSRNARSTHKVDSDGLDSHTVTPRSHRQYRRRSESLDASISHHRHRDSRSTQPRRRRPFLKNGGSARRCGKGSHDSRSDREKRTYRHEPFSVPTLRHCEWASRSQRNNALEDGRPGQLHHLPEYPDDMSNRGRHKPWVQHREGPDEQGHFDWWAEGSSEGEVVLRRSARRVAPLYAKEYCRRQDNNVTLQRERDKSDLLGSQQHQQQPDQFCISQKRDASGSGLRKISAKAQQQLTPEASRSASVLLLLSGGRLQPLACGRPPASLSDWATFASTPNNVAAFTSSDRRSSAVGLPTTTAEEVSAPVNTDAAAAAASSVRAPAFGIAEDTAKNSRNSGGAIPASGAAATPAADKPLFSVEATSSGALYNARNMLPSPQFSDLSLSSGEVQSRCTPSLPPASAIPAALSVTTPTADVADRIPPIVASFSAANAASVIPAVHASGAAPSISVGILQRGPAAAGGASPFLSATSRDKTSTADELLRGHSHVLSPPSNSFLPSSGPPVTTRVASLGPMAADAAPVSTPEGGNLFTFACQIPSPVPCFPSIGGSVPSASEAPTSESRKLQVGTSAEKTTKGAPVTNGRCTPAAVLTAAADALKPDHFPRATAKPQTLLRSERKADTSDSKEGKETALAGDDPDVHEQVHDHLSGGVGKLTTAGVARETSNVTETWPGAATAIFPARGLKWTEESPASAVARRTAAATSSRMATNEKYQWRRELEELGSLATDEVSVAECTSTRDLDKEQKHEQVDAEVREQRMQQARRLQRQLLESDLQQLHSSLQLLAPHQQGLQSSLQHDQQVLPPAERARSSFCSTDGVVQSELYPRCITTPTTECQLQEPGIAKRSLAAAGEASSRPAVDNFMVQTHISVDLPCSDQRRLSNQHYLEEPSYNVGADEKRGCSRETENHSISNTASCTDSSKRTDESGVDNRQHTGPSEGLLSDKEHTRSVSCLEPAHATKTRGLPYDTNTPQEPVASQEAGNSLVGGSPGANNSIAANADVTQARWSHDNSSDYDSPQTHLVRQLVSQQQQVLLQHAFYRSPLPQLQTAQPTVQHDDPAKHKNQPSIPLRQESRLPTQPQQQVWQHTWQQPPDGKKRHISRLFSLSRRFRISSLHRARSLSSADSVPEKELPSLTRRNSELQATERRLQRLYQWNMRRESPTNTTKLHSATSPAIQMARRSSCPPPMGLEARGKPFPIPLLHAHFGKAVAGAAFVTADEADKACTIPDHTQPAVTYCSAGHAAIPAGQIDGDLSSEAAGHPPPHTASGGAIATNTLADRAFTLYGCSTTAVAHNSFADTCGVQESPTRKTSPPVINADAGVTEACVATATESATVAATAAAAVGVTDYNTEEEWCMQPDMQDAPPTVDIDESPPFEEPEKPVVDSAAEKWKPPSFSHSSTTFCSLTVPEESACSFPASSAAPDACGSSSASSANTLYAPCQQSSLAMFPTESPHVEVANEAKCNGVKSELLLRVSAHAQRLMQRAKQLHSRRMSS